MTATPTPTRVQLAQKKLLFIFILAAIGWLSLSAFLPPLIIFSLLDVVLFFLIWHGWPIAKFLTVPMFLIRGTMTLLATLFVFGLWVEGSREAGRAFFAAMLPGFLAFTVYSLGAGVGLPFIPNIAETRKAEAFGAQMRSKLAASTAKLAARQVKSSSLDEDPASGLPESSGVSEN